MHTSSENKQVFRDMKVLAEYFTPSSDLEFDLFKFKFKFIFCIHWALKFQVESTTIIKSHQRFNNIHKCFVGWHWQAGKLWWLNVVSALSLSLFFCIKTTCMAIKNLRAIKFWSTSKNNVHETKQNVTNSQPHAFRFLLLCRRDNLSRNMRFHVMISLCLSAVALKANTLM